MNKSKFVVRARDGFNPIDLLPSQHYSLPFAESVIRLLCRGEISYRQLFLECPDDGDFQKHVISLIASGMPGCGVVVSPSENQITELTGPVFDYDGNKFAEEGEPIFACSAIPVSPTDSICTAIWCADSLNARAGLQILCGDVPTAFKEQQKPERAVESEDAALENPFRHSAGEVSLEDYWKQTNLSEPCAYDQARDAHMSANLEEHQLKGPTLAVIGAAHMNGIIRHLRDETGSKVKDLKPAEKTHSDAKLVPVSPKLMHEIGWLEFPAIAEAFVHYAAGVARSDGKSDEGFDVSKALKAVVDQAVHITGKDINPRALSVFERFMNNYLTSTGRWLPPTLGELVKWGEFCISKRFGDALYKAANHSPLIDKTGPGMQRVLYVPEYQGLLARLESGKLHFVSIGQPGDNAGGVKTRRVSSYNQGRIGLSREERKGTRIWGGNPSTQEYHFRNAMNRAIRRIAHKQLASEEARKNREWESRPWKGCMNLGIDLPSTIRERAAGKPKAVCVKTRKKPEHDVHNPECQNLCPVVYIFNNSLSNEDISYYQTGDYYLPKYHSPAAAYFYVGKKRTPHPGIKIREMAIYANLYWAEADQYDREESQKWLESNIPEDYICKIKPWSDEMEDFQSDPISTAVAWAVRFSQHHCVIVSESWIELPLKITQYAESRNVEILRVSSAAIGEECFDRMRWDTEVSDNQNPGGWTEKFTRPIPAY